MPHLVLALMTGQGAGAPSLLKYIDMESETEFGSNNTTPTSISPLSNGNYLNIGWTHLRDAGTTKVGGYAQIINKNDSSIVATKLFRPNPESTAQTQIIWAGQHSSGDIIAVGFHSDLNGGDSLVFRLSSTDLSTIAVYSLGEAGYDAPTEAVMIGDTVFIGGYNGSENGVWRFHEVDVSAGSIAYTTTHRISTTGTGGAVPTVMRVNNAGNIVVAGQTGNSGAPQALYIFNSTMTSILGDSEITGVSPYSMDFDSSDNIYIVGSRSGQGSQPGIMKVSSDGTTLLGQSGIYTPTTTVGETFTDVVVDSNNDVYAIGYYDFGISARNDIVLAKYNSSVVLQEYHVLRWNDGGDINSHERNGLITLTGDGGKLVMTGQSGISGGYYFWWVTDKTPTTGQSVKYEIISSTPVSQSPSATVSGFTGSILSTTTVANTGTPSLTATDLTPIVFDG